MGYFVTMIIIREKSAEVLSKMVMDKLVGPKVRICVTRFLPTIFLDAMKQSPEAAVSMLDSEHENPELIWNEDTRKKVVGVQIVMIVTSLVCRSPEWWQRSVANSTSSRSRARRVLGASRRTSSCHWRTCQER